MSVGPFIRGWTSGLLQWELLSLPTLRTACVQVLSGLHRSEVVQGHRCGSLPPVSTADPGNL